MPREGVTYEAYQAFAEGFLAEHGKKPTVRQAIEALGGSATTINDHQRRWRQWQTHRAASEDALQSIPDDLMESVSAAVTNAVQPVWAALVQSADVREEALRAELLSEHDRRRDELEQAEAESQERVEAAELAAKILTQRLKDAHEQLEDKDDALEQQRRVAAAAETKAAQLEGRLTSQAAELEALRTELRDHRAAYETERDTWADTRRRLERELEQAAGHQRVAEAAAAEYKTRLDDVTAILEKESAAREREFKRAERFHTEREHAQRAHREEMQTSASRLQKAEAERMAAENRVTAATMRADALQMQLDELRALHMATIAKMDVQGALEALLKQQKADDRK